MFAAINDIFIDPYESAAASRAYLGTGPAAEETARAIDLRRRQRLAEVMAAQELVQKHAAAKAAIDQFEQLIDQVMKATLIGLGFHQHQRGHWRRRMPETNTTAMKQPLSEEVKDLLKRANKGDESLVPQVKALLDQLPELVAECGDLVKEAQQILLEWATGSALTSREAISRHVEQYRERLAATASSELEKILVDRVVISYLEVYTADVRFCQRAGPGPGGQCGGAGGAEDH